MVRVRRVLYLSRPDDRLRPAEAAPPEPGGIVAWAIAARGGRLESVRRDVEATVHYGFPGTWHWRTVFHVPDLYRWTLLTHGEPQHHVFDGTAVRAFVGDALVSVDAAPAAGFRSHARWMAMVSLDVLTDGTRTAWAELSPARAPRPSDGVRGLRSRYLDDWAPGGDGGATYELWFDTRGRLVVADGPITFPGFTSGRLRATFTDFRTVAGYVFPFAGRYEFNGRALFDEKVTGIVANDPALTPASFTAPRADPPMEPSHP